MVTKINSSKSTRSSLMYNERKVQTGMGKQLFASGFPVHAEVLDLESKLKVFKMLTDQNRRSIKHTLHFTLNFSSYDILDELKLKRLANRFMTKMGLDRQPYLVYQHYDTMHAHLHIVTVKIADGGKNVEPRFKVFKEVNEALETEFGLERTQDYKVQQRPVYSNNPPKWFHYGDEDTAKGVAKVVNSVLHNYKYGNIMEYDAILNQFGILVIYGGQGTRINLLKGLRYGVINAEGRKTCCPVKAHHLNGKPILVKVEQRFESNIDSRSSKKQRLINLIENAFLLGNKYEFEYYLRKCGIRLVFNKNPAGELYGAVYIDNGTKCAWQDFNLGEKFKAAPLLASIERLPEFRASNVSAIDRCRHMTDEQSKLDRLRNDLFLPHDNVYAATQLPVVQVITDFKPIKHESYKKLAETQMKLKTMRQQMLQQRKGRAMDIDIGL